MSEGVLYGGSHTSVTYQWIVEFTARVNHYYFYCVDEDFGPFFLKFCPYFPTMPSSASTATSKCAA